MTEETRHTILSFILFGIRAALIIGVILGFITGFVLGMFTSDSSAQTGISILFYGFFCLVSFTIMGAINGFFAGVVTARQTDPHSNAFMYWLKIVGTGFCVAISLCILLFTLVVVLDDVKFGYLPVIAFGQIGLTCMLSSALMARWHLAKPEYSPAREIIDRRGEPLP